MSVIICILVFRGDAEGPRDVAESGGTNLTVHGLFCVLWVCLVHALVDKTRRNQQVGTLMVLVFFD